MKFLSKLLRNFGKPQTYGSALETYIVSNNPKTVEDIDYLQRRFEQLNLQRLHGWPT